MGFFRKLRKLGSLHIASPRNVRRPMRDEAPPLNVQYGPLPRSFFSAVNLAREEAGHEPLPINRHRPKHRGDEHLMNQNFRPEFDAFDRNRRASHEQWYDRSDRDGSPDHFHRELPGTPVKYRRRPVSPELLRPSVPPPFGFGQHSVPSSPDMLRRFQHAQQPPQQQFDRMMPHPAQFYPQFQQQFHPMMNPHPNMQPWFMMPQQQMQQFF